MSFSGCVVRRPATGKECLTMRARGEMLTCECRKSAVNSNVDEVDNPSDSVTSTPSSFSVMTYGTCMAHVPNSATIESHSGRELQGGRPIWIDM